MNRKELFNAMAETWDVRCRHDPDRIDEILDLVPIRLGDAVLDVGTGTGILIPFLLKRIGPKGMITAMDMAEKMIRIAKRKFGSKRIRFVAGDIFDVELAPSTFDAIVCYSVFPHFEDKRRAVRRLAGALKPGGALAVCHSQGREHVNRLHGTLHPAVAEDHLPEARVVAEYFLEAWCDILAAVDTERLFVVIGRKR
jgi:ubiquinone/menaquinone biosynthesis C-methylase UbiE